MGTDAKNVCLVISRRHELRLGRKVGLPAPLEWPRVPYVVFVLQNVTFFANGSEEELELVKVDFIFH